MKKLDIGGLPFEDLVDFWFNDCHFIFKDNVYINIWIPFDNNNGYAIDINVFDFEI